jgi:hypothetical protein
MCIAGGFLAHEKLLSNEPPERPVLRKWLPEPSNRNAYNTAQSLCRYPRTPLCENRVWVNCAHLGEIGHASQTCEAREKAAAFS